MSTSPAVRDDAARGHVDAAAALEQFAKARQLDPDVVERVRARAEQIKSEIRREHGLVDDKIFQSLLDDEA